MSSAAIKSVHDITIGDTLTVTENKATEPLPGYQEAKPDGVFGIYPMSSDEYGDLVEAPRQAGPQRRVALTYEPETPRPRSVRVSAAASSGYSTWRSCRSGWSGSTTSLCSLSAPSVSYKRQHEDR